MLAILPTICSDLWNKEIQLQTKVATNNLMHSYSMNEAYALLDANSTDSKITAKDVSQLIFYGDSDDDKRLNKTEFLGTFR